MSPIDLQLAIEKAKHENVTDSVTAFQSYVRDLHDANDIENEIHNVDTEIEDLQLDDDAISLAQLARNRQKCKMLKNRRAELAGKLEKKHKNIGLQVGCGPVSASLDDELQKHNIQRQAYHSKSFVGNHCHKYLQSDVYESVCNRVVMETKHIISNEDIISKANAIAKTFVKLNKYYAAVHNSISDDLPKSDEDIRTIKRSVDTYLRYYRSKFPQVRLTLKQHLLEDHCIEWLKRTKMGFGLMGEQGVESIHHKMNDICSYMRGIKKPTARLLSGVEEHYLSTLPQIKEQYPEPKKRKH